MSLLGRVKCWLNGHYRSVGGYVYECLEQTYVLSEDLHLKYCPRCQRVSLSVRVDRGHWNPLYDDEDEWELLEA